MKNPIFTFILGISTAITVFLGNSFAIDNSFSIHQEKDVWCLETPFFTRHISTAGDTLRTIKIINKITNESFAIQSDEFQLTIDEALYLTSGHFAISNSRVKKDENSQTLICELRAKKYPFLVEVHFTIWQDKPYLRKGIKVKEEDKKGHILNYAQIERMFFQQIILGNKVHYKDVVFRDYYQNPPQFPVTDGNTAINDGQPVFGPGIFMGVEFPAAINKVLDNDVVGLGAYIQKSLSGSWIDTRTAVIGVSAEDNVEEAFMSYIKDIRNSPAKPRIVYNTWYDIQDMNETNMLQRVVDFKTYFKDPFNFNPDIFLLDDGWDNTHSLWEIDSVKFPHGFTSIVENLQSLGINFGLWVSPFGGYDIHQKERISAARKNGYEITDHDQYCIAGKKYREAFKKCFVNYVKQYKIKFFKLDGILNICNRSDHGHLPGQPSRAALTDAYLEIMHALKEADPEVCLNITSGFWLSPWWLQYVDMGYPGGFDWWYTRAVPSISKRDASTVFRDKVLYDKFTGHQYMYPVSDLMLIGLIKGQLNMLGGYQETLREWCNEVTLMLMRGYFCWELYITPSILSYDERSFMVKALQWGKENADLLSNTKLFLGDPYKREISGYAHCKDDYGVIGLRNPFIDSQIALIPLDHSIGLNSKPSEKFLIKQLYPYSYLLPGIYSTGDRVNIPVDGYETKVLEIIPSVKDFSITCKSSEVSAAQFKINKINFNETDEFNSENGFQITSDIFLPESADLFVLVEGEKSAESIDIDVVNNGSLLNYTVERDSISFGSILKGDQRDWRWQIYSLSPGQQQIDFTIKQNGKISFQGLIGAWVRYALPMIKAAPVEFNPLELLPSKIKTIYPEFKRELNYTHRLFYKQCAFN